MSRKELTIDLRENISEQMADIFFRLSLILLGFLVIIFIILIKSETLADFYQHPLLVFYTVFVTGFEFSRLLGAAIYPRVDRTISNHTASQEHAEQDFYEPTVSFVIPCMNEEAVIAETVERCFAVDYPREKLEVIVINDGSTDNTLWELRKAERRHPELKIISWQKNQGKRHGMAAGFRQAKGEIILQLDSDSYIEARNFRNVIKPFKNKEIGAVCVHADPANADQNFITKMQAAYYFMSFRILKAAESSFLSVLCCSGCSSAYRKSIVLPILDKWLAESFLGKPVTWGDDRALTNWVLRQGHQTIYTDRAQAYTICPDKLRQFIKQQVRWKKGWFVNSLFASGFILRDHPFIAFTYFFPLLLITVATPFIVTRALVLTPIINQSLPIFYILGVMLIAALVTVFYRWIDREKKYWQYIFVWSGINLVVLSFILFYALATIQNRGWGTR